eukprot:3122789-Pyramimonas_sp.AAC.3
MPSNGEGGATSVDSKASDVIRGSRAKSDGSLGEWPCGSETPSEVVREGDLFSVSEDPNPLD